MQLFLSLVQRNHILLPVAGKTSACPSASYTLLRRSYNVKVSLVDSLWMRCWSIYSLAYAFDLRWGRFPHWIYMSASYMGLHVFTLSWQDSPHSSLSSCSLTTTWNLVQLWYCFHVLYSCRLDVECFLQWTYNEWLIIHSFSATVCPALRGARGQASSGEGRVAPWTRCLLITDIKTNNQSHLTTGHFRVTKMYLSLWDFFSVGNSRTTWRRTNTVTGRTRQGERHRFVPVLCPGNKLWHSTGKLTAIS